MWTSMRLKDWLLPGDFDCRRVVEKIANGPNGAWEPTEETKHFAQVILDRGLEMPHADGENHGDHPPTTPKVDNPVEDDEEASGEHVDIDEVEGLAPFCYSISTPHGETPSRVGISRRDKIFHIG